jgi:hypothetical protein
LPPVDVPTGVGAAIGRASLIRSAREHVARFEDERMVGAQAIRQAAHSALEQRFRAGAPASLRAGFCQPQQGFTHIGARVRSSCHSFGEGKCVPRISLGIRGCVLAERDL